MSGPATLPLRDAAFWQDPYPAIDDARAAHRTALTPTGEPVILSADDHEAVLAHPAMETLGLEALDRLGVGDGPFRSWRALSLNVHNGPDHARLRSLVGRAFTPRQVERIRAGVRTKAHSLIDAAADSGEMDVVSAFAHDLPIWLICVFLGIDEADRAEIEAFLVGTEEGFAFPMTPEREARANAGIAALNDYSLRLIERRRLEPDDGLVSALVAARDGSDRLSEPELLAMVVNLIGGAVGSSRAAIANAIHLFSTHPAQADLLRREPDRARGAIEECLRHAPPFRSTRRRAAETIEVAGLTVEAGKSVFLSRQAGNRDPERFADPHRFDIDRPEHRHVSFGYGAHFCLGQALARADLQEAIPVFLARCHDLEPLVDTPERVPFQPTEEIVSLPIRFRHVEADRPREAT